MKIAEVSEKYDIPADTLRYYEKIGLIPGVHRTSGGVRDYTDGDCGWVEFIKCMRGAGLSIDALTRYVALWKQGDSTMVARRDLLVEQRSELLDRMADMQATLDRLNYKIEKYEKCDAYMNSKLGMPEDQRVEHQVA